MHNTIAGNVAGQWGALVVGGGGRFSNNTIVANNATGEAPPASVRWVRVQGSDTAVGPGWLTRKAGSGWNHGAVSQDAFDRRSVVYGVRFRCAVKEQTSMIGLSRGDWNGHYNDIDFAIYCTGGKLQVYERGSHVHTSNLEYEPHHVLEVRVNANSKVEYATDGVMFYTSGRTVVYPLRVESLRVVWTRVWSLCVGTRVCWASPLLPVSTEALAVCARGDCDNRGGARGEEGS